MDMRRRRGKRSDLKQFLPIIIPAALLLLFLILYLYSRSLPAITIRLEGDDPVVLENGQEYTDPGVTALVNGVFRDQAVDLQIIQDINYDKPGTYTVLYLASAEGVTATASRHVTVKEPVNPAVKRAEPNGKVICLTFDDGPSPLTERVLDTLDQYGVKATFFVTGAKSQYFYLLEREAREGHGIGVHSFSHDYNKIYSSSEAFWDDFEAMEKVIEEQTGSRTRLLRFPGGSSNTVSDFNPGIMTQLVKEAEEKGYFYFDWNVSSGDAVTSLTADEVVKNVKEGVALCNTSVILCHDTKEFTADALEKIIIWGLENGYTFEPLTEESFGAHHAIYN